MTSAGRGITSELKIRILRKYDSLSNAERKVADAALRCGEQLIDYTIARLAQESGVSEPTVLRLCYSLDFRGFKEMKKASVATMAPPASPSTESLTLDEVDDDEKLIAFVLNNMQQVLRETHTLLDRGELARAIRLLDDAHHVRVVGVGGSSVVARHVWHYLRKAGLQVTLLSAYDPEDAFLEQYEHNDVLIAISYLGRTSFVTDVAVDAKRKGASVIGITAWGENKLSQLSDVALQVPYGGTGLTGDYFAVERIGQIAVVNMLFAALYAARQKEKTPDSRGLRTV